MAKTLIMEAEVEAVGVEQAGLAPILKIQALALPERVMQAGIPLITQISRQGRAGAAAAKTLQAKTHLAVRAAMGAMA